jgi:uncharacterized membrane protein YcfT
LSTFEQFVDLNRNDVGTATGKATANSRVKWVDYAKGICILLVVLMHSTLGVEKSLNTTSWLSAFIEWARPFRMPDFFMLSGLFLCARIHKPWRQFMDSKVLHFVYFYLLWMTLLFVLKDVLAGDARITDWAFYLIEPHGAIWFIYMLPVFMVTIRLLKDVSPALVFGIAAALEILPVHTGWMVIDEFAARFVYIYAGFWLAPQIFKLASIVDALKIWQTMAALGLWALINTVAVQSGVAAMPGISLALGCLGAGAVITMGVLLSKFNFSQALRYCGENSLAIYLSFSLFMSVTRVLIIKSGLIADAGTIALMCMISGVCGSLILLKVSKYCSVTFLFKRPVWARL